MENPIKMDDLGVPLFLETPKWLTMFFFLLAPGMPNFPRPAGYLLVYGLGASLSDECYEKPDEYLGCENWIVDHYPYHPWDWYISLDLANLYGTCIGKYTIHGWYG